MTAKDRQELAKTRDPKATENYCQGVVQEFKAVQQKTHAVKEFRDEVPSGMDILEAKLGAGGAPMAFDQWTPNFGLISTLRR